MNIIIDEYKKMVFERIESLGPQVTELSDWMADNPELSGKEYEISKKYVDILKKYGYDTVNKYMGIETSFLATIRKGQGPKVAFLSEYDALPEIGHGCGHNLSGCISLLAAMSFGSEKNIINGSLSLIGTPDEEARGPKVHMAAQGAFDDYDLAMMIHMYGDNMVVKKFVALDAVEFVFSGRPAHAGTSPWSGANALNGAQLFFHAIDMLRQHVKPDVRMHGVILEGGLGPTPNIVPDRAVVRFHFRAHKRKYLNEVMKMVRDCAKGAALATQTLVASSYFEPKADEMLRNKAAESMVEKIYTDTGIPIDEEDDYETISSDMFAVSQRCPAIHGYLSICPKNTPIHTRAFAEATKGEAAHRAVIKGAKILAASALSIFYDDNLRQSIKSEFMTNRNQFFAETDKWL